jgi:hypothetical protein
LICSDTTDPDDKWNCMFAFHLGLHLPQAEYVVGKARAEQAGGGHASARELHH